MILVKFERSAAVLAAIALGFGAGLPLEARTPIGSLANTQGVTLVGAVGNVVGNDFILKDESGAIIVDAGPRWWRPLNLTPGERVTVIGEYDQGEFDAFTIIRANGEAIQIRPAQGKPPWAGKDKD
ncbi:MAG: NirD/YgiW/YdeI family stress tolerance protein [Cyanobacteria bacterium RI_101]|nr:NirD/YgiW/YdeI family stress tolerance protein [Cyanobacteria bacterium RI_101]